MIFDKGAYLTLRPIFHMALNFFLFDCEITLESVPVTSQYLAMRVKFLVYIPIALHVYLSWFYRFTS
mgnify:CR=1 FL=1